MCFNLKLNEEKMKRKISFDTKRETKMSGVSGAKLIIQAANQLRSNQPNRYGVKGAREGQPGYVKGGWRRAVIDAAAGIRQQTGKQPAPKSMRKGQLIPKGSIQRAYYNGYKDELRQLKSKYQVLTNKFVHPSKKKTSFSNPDAVPRKLFAGQVFNAGVRRPQAQPGLRAAMEVVDEL